MSEQTDLDVELVERLAARLGVPLLDGDAPRVAAILAGQLAQIAAIDRLDDADLSWTDPVAGFEVQWR